jgi:hypothetical protein
LRIWDFVLVSIIFLRRPFPQSLSPSFGITKMVRPEPAIEGSNEEVEERGWSLWMNFL